MKVVTYNVTLLEPTLVTELDGDPNSAVAFNFLPGSVLRGAIIGKFVHHEKSGNSKYEFKADNSAARRLFLNGKTRYLNGYPIGPSKQRSLPVPLSWQHEKDDVVQQPKGEIAPIHDLSANDSNRLEQPQSLNHPFCLFDDEVKLIKPRRHFAVHTARTRRYGRAMKNIDEAKGDTRGAVYRYESLASEQTFAATIICEEDGDADVLFALLEEKAGAREEAVLGGSRTGGYGRCEFHDVAREEIEEWREYERAAAKPHDEDGSGSKNRVLTITLLSDSLVRSENGQYAVDTAAIQAALARQMRGATLKPCGDRVFMRGRIVGGFNRKWGLPLPQTLAVQMGSVFVFEAQNCDDSMIDELEQQGIGERRAEGFGRVAVDWHKKPLLTAHSIRRLPQAYAQELDGDCTAVARRMATRLLRQRLDAQVIEQARKKEIEKRKRPHNSQLARLRDAIHVELRKSEPDVNRIKKYLQEIEDRRFAKKQFETARIGGQQLLKWLKDALDVQTKDEWEQLLDLQPTMENYLKSVAGIRPDLSENLRNEYLLRYVDAVLARAAKQAREED